MVRREKFNEAPRGPVAGLGKTALEHRTGLREPARRFLTVAFEGDRDCLHRSSPYHQKYEHIAKPIDRKG
jgi:hypothetical protein